jgi:hypothetical protein
MQSSFRNTYLLILNIKDHIRINIVENTYLLILNIKDHIRINIVERVLIQCF